MSFGLRCWSCALSLKGASPRRYHEALSMKRTLLLLAATVLQGAEPADWIVSGRYVVTMDAQRRVIENGAVAIRGERILAAGARAQIDQQYSAKQRLDHPNTVILPGLIDTHTHAPMSLFRGLADDKRLQE